MAPPHQISGLSLYSPGSWKWLAVAHEAAWGVEWKTRTATAGSGPRWSPSSAPPAPSPVLLAGPSSSELPLSGQSNCISFSREHVLSTHPSKGVSDAGEQSRFPPPGSWLNQDGPGRVWLESVEIHPEMMFLKAVVKQCTVVLCVL